jgi:streptogramin lyase
MSGPKRQATHAILAALVLSVCGGLYRSGELSAAPDTAEALDTAEAPDTAKAEPSGTPDSTSSLYELRTESILDRETLEAAGIRRPTRLSYDSDGNLHVLDAETRRVTKLDPRGHVLYEVGGYGSDETSLELPVDIVVDRDQSLLVLDRGRGALVAFDRSGRFLGQRPFQGAAAEESRGAGARILLDRLGTLWLLSAHARDLMPLDDRLKPARATRYLVPEDSVGAPIAAAASPGGEVWIWDSTRGTLRRFAATGRWAFSSVMSRKPEEMTVSDLAADRAGYLYAADPVGQRVLVFAPDGFPQVNRALGGDRIHWRPRALAIGPRRQVAVADPERDEIQVLVPVWRKWTLRQ